MEKTFFAFTNFGLKVAGLIGFFLSILAIMLISLETKDLQLGRSMLEFLKIIRIWIVASITLFYIWVIAIVIREIIVKQWKKKYQ